MKDENILIGGRLKLVRAALGEKTRSEMASALGVKENQIADIERGKTTITEMVLKNLNRHFEVRPEYLMHGQEPVFISIGEIEFKKRIADLGNITKTVDEIDELKDYEKASLKEVLYGLRSFDMNIVKNALKSNADYLMVPKYDIAASAGNGSVINDEAIVDHLAFKREWIKSLGLDAQHIALIDVRGDSMTPTISNGDLILLDTRKGQHLCEGIYAIYLNDGLLVKRIRIKLSGLVEVVSDNAQYGTETLAQDNLASLVIVGRVVWHGRRV